MARLQPNEFQLYDGTSWHGTTQRNHFFSAFADQPEVQMQMVQDIERVNLGDDFVSMVERFATEYIEAGADGVFEWALDYTVDSNYECLGAFKDRAGTIAIAATDEVGANGSVFYLDFKGKVFENTEVISGMNPYLDRLFVHEAFEVGPDRWRMRVGLAHSRGPEDFYLGSQVMINTRWSNDAALAPKYGADRGVDISFKTPTRAQGELSSYRVQHKIYGHMIDDWRPKWFYIKDKNGKIVNNPLWISTVELEFMRKIRYIKANLIMYGRSNRWANGEYGLRDDNGNYIQAGSGFYEQILSSNTIYYSGLPGLDQLTDLALSTSVGKIGFGNRDFMIKAGEYGLAALARMVEHEIGPAAIKNKPFLGDTTGRAYRWEKNDVYVNMGQIKQVATINGIRFHFVYDPSKDHEGRNKVKMGNGLPGLLSSYQYDIMGFGGKDEMANFKIVRRNGQTPSFGVVEGMRGMFSKGTSIATPKQLSTSIDAFELVYQDFGIGAKLLDPSKVIRYYPSAQPV